MAVVVAVAIAPTLVQVVVQAAVVLVRVGLVVLVQRLQFKVLRAVQAQAITLAVVAVLVKQETRMEHRKAVTDFLQALRVQRLLVLAAAAVV
jgi:hypothetical protein